MTVRLVDKVDGADYAILCGAGVSATAGLPVATGLHDLILEYADQASVAAVLRLYPAQRAESPRLSFEGILDVFQRLIDPELSVLGPYARGFIPFAGSDHQPVGPTRIHVALAKAAMEAPVITTNIDALIEAAAFDVATSNVPFSVASDEDAFKASADHPSPGLWKIHGTLCRIVAGSAGRLPPADPSGPVVTLQYISRTRESLARQQFLKATLKHRTTVIVGYSGSDDFDVTVWLREVESPRRLVWIQYLAGPSREVPIEQVAGGAPGFDDGLRKLARAWVKDHRRDRLTIITAERPEALLCEWQRVSLPEPEGRTRQRLDRLPRSPWERAIISGALLAQLCHFPPAISAFERAHTLACSQFESAATRLELARAWLELGGSQRNFTHADDWAEEALKIPAGSPQIEGIHARARMIKVTARSRMKLSADVEAELESIVAAYKDHPSPDLRAAAFTALAEIAVRRRWRGSRSPKPQGELLASGPLPPKGTLAHGEALSTWKQATSCADLETAVASLHEAAEFRREMGDIGGLCASLNVLSLFAQRWAFMLRELGTAPSTPLGTFPGASAPTPEAALASAAEWSEESLAFARRHAIPFHVGQALISLGICRLRQGRVNDASAAFTELCTMSDLDSRTDLEARFCAAMLLVASGRPDTAAPFFTQVASEAGAIVTDKFDERIAAIGEAADLNAALCLAWSEERPRPLGRTIALTHRKPVLAPDRARLAELEAVVPSSALDAATRILDPLGP